MNAVAEQYVRLVLAVGQHDADYVDAFYGPQAWRDEAERTKAPLTAIDAADEAEPTEASLPEMTPMGAPHENGPQPANGHRADAMNDGAMERRTGKDRRESPAGSTLFSGPERRMGVFGRRHADQYETSGRK